MSSTQGLPPFGHLGWAYDKHAELKRRAAEHIADGLASAQTIVPRDPPAIASRLIELLSLRAVRVESDGAMR